MKKTTILIAGLLAVSLTTVPTALAHHADDESDVNAANEYYVTVDEDEGLTVWEETNGHEGLQTSQTSYAPGDDGCQGDDRERHGTCYAPSDEPVEV